MSAPALYGRLFGGRGGVACLRQIQKKAVDYSDWFSHPCAQKDGRVRFECSSIGWIYMLRGGETRCSAVWSAHLFWVQRAIGSNPVTLMWIWEQATWSDSKRTQENFMLAFIRHSKLVSVIIRAFGAVYRIGGYVLFCSFSGFFFAWIIPFLDSLDWLLSLMEGIPLYGGDAGRGVSSSTEPSLPAAEEEPGDRSETERALDQLELAKVQEPKNRLAEQISPLIESEKARLVRRLWHRNLGDLPSPSEMVEILIERFASKAAYNANKPNAPRAHYRHLKAWLTRTMGRGI